MFWVGVTGSICLHILLAVYFYLGPVKKLIETRKNKNVTIEIKAQSNYKAISKAELAPKFSKRAKPKSLQDLVGSSSYWEKNIAPSLDKKNAGASDESWMYERPEYRAKSFMDSYGVDKYVKDMPFFEELWGRIDKNLAYPKDFVKQRLQGFVQVDIMVNEKGQFTGEVLKLNSSQKILGAYVLSLLIIALKKPLAYEISSNSKSIPVALSFKFEYYNFHKDKLEETGGHQKNILHFHRKRYVEPVVNKYLNKVFTRYIPPIIPFPGGVYVDLIRLYQYINNIGTEDPDELRLKRIKLKLKEMNEFIKSSEIVEII